MSRWLEVPERPFEVQPSSRRQPRCQARSPNLCKEPAIRRFVIPLSPLIRASFHLKLCGHHADELGEE